MIIINILCFIQITHIYVFPSMSTRLVIIIKEGTHWAMLFSDDLVLCDHDREIMEVRLERRRECMDQNGQSIGQNQNIYTDNG